MCFCGVKLALRTQSISSDRLVCSKGVQDEHSCEWGEEVTGGS
jgi:hypothetical protein